MVEYHEWVSIVFSEAKTQGFDASFNGNSEVVQVAAAVWNDNRTFLMAASGKQAKELAEEEITVQ